MANDMRSFPRHWLSGFTACLLSMLVGSCATEPSPHAVVSAPTVSTPAATPVSAPHNEAAVEPAAKSSEAEVITGTGEFVKAAGEGQAAEAVTEDALELSFVDTDISTVASTLFGDVLGAPYTVDPSIHGTITLQSSKPLPKQDLLAAFENALRLQDIAIVQRNGVYNIVPAAAVSKQILGVRRPGEKLSPGYGVRVVPVRYVSVSEMERILAPFGQGGVVVREEPPVPSRSGTRTRRTRADRRHL
jgi:general secretion pathway protein D